MEHKFKIGDRVYSKVFNELGRVDEIYGETIPYLVKFENGNPRWHFEDDLMHALDLEDLTNDAGEDTSCTIDDTLEERGKRYGTFEKHSELSQKLLGDIRYHCAVYDKKLSHVHTEALSMICHKIARIVNGDPDYDDSWRDIAGYAQLVVKHLNGEDV